jgi:hypothetical protein
MFKKSSAVVVAALLCAAPIAEAGRQEPLYDPGSVTVDCKTMTAEGMKKAIRSAMLARKWMPSEKGPGVMAGKLMLRTHTLEVEVKYTAKTFDINYINSENLMYEMEDGQPVIHRNANTWIRNLEQDIQLQISTNC